MTASVFFVFFEDGTGVQLGVGARACASFARSSCWGIWLGFRVQIVSPCGGIVVLLGMVNFNLGRQVPVGAFGRTLGSDGCVVRSRTATRPPPTCNECSVILRLLASVAVLGTFIVNRVEGDVDCRLGVRTRVFVASGGGSGVCIVSGNGQP